MDLSKFLSMIGKKTLYFASAESFEDIFEGAKGTLELKEKWDAFYLNFFKEAIQTAPGMKPEDLTAEYIEENAIRLLSELNASGNVERKHTFISCWHCNQYTDKRGKRTKHQAGNCGRPYNSHYAWTKCNRSASHHG